jgi:WD40 repeat protein
MIVRFFCLALLVPTLAFADASRVNDVVVGRDGKTIIVAFADKTLHVVEIPSGKELKRIEAPESAARLAISPDGKVLAAAEFRELALIDVGSWKDRARVDHPTRSMDIDAVAFSPDGKTVALAGGMGIIKLYDTATAKELRSFEGLKSIVNAITFSSDGKTFAAAGIEKIIGIWDTAGSTPMRTTGTNTAKYKALTFLADGKRLVTVDEDGTVAIWNATGGDASATIKGDRGYTHLVAASRDGKLLAWDGADNKVTVWDLAAGKELKKIVAASTTASALAFTPDSKFIIVGDEHGKIHRVNVAEGSAVGVPSTK